MVQLMRFVVLIIMVIACDLQAQDRIQVSPGRHLISEQITLESGATWICEGPPGSCELVWDSSSIRHGEIAPLFYVDSSESPIHDIHIKGFSITCIYNLSDEPHGRITQGLRFTVGEDIENVTIENNRFEKCDYGIQDNEVRGKEGRIINAEVTGNTFSNGHMGWEGGLFRGATFKGNRFENIGYSASSIYGNSGHPLYFNEHGEDVLVIENVEDRCTKVNDGPEHDGGFHFRGGTLRDVRAFYNIHRCAGGVSYDIGYCTNCQIAYNVVDQLEPARPAIRNYDRKALGLLIANNTIAVRQGVRAPDGLILVSGTRSMILHNKLTGTETSRGAAITIRDAQDVEVSGNYIDGIGAMGILLIEDGNSKNISIFDNAIHSVPKGIINVVGKAGSFSANVTIEGNTIEAESPISLTGTHGFKVMSNQLIGRGKTIVYSGQNGYIGGNGALVQLRSGHTASDVVIDDK